MARLPQPGGDDGAWGTILNDFLTQSLNNDGTIKDDAIGPAQLQDNAVTAPAIASGTISENKLDTNVQNKLNTVGSGGIADGSITTLKLQDEAVTDAKVSATADIAISKISGLQTALDGKASTSHTHTAANISDSTSTGRSVLTAASQSAARTAIGLGNVNNTSDTDKPVSTLTQAAIDAAIVTARQVSVNAQNGSYTLVLSDAGKAIEVTSSSSVNLTVPPNSSVAFPVGTMIEVAQMGSGQVTLNPGSGVTLLSAGDLLSTRTQYSVVSLRKRSTNTWLVAGDLA